MSQSLWVLTAMLRVFQVERNLLKKSGPTTERDTHTNTYFTMFLHLHSMLKATRIANKWTINTNVMIGWIHTLMQHPCQWVAEKHLHMHHSVTCSLHVCSKPQTLKILIKMCKLKTICEKLPYWHWKAYFQHFCQVFWNKERLVLSFT